MNAEELKKRTKKFSLRVLKLVGALPENVQGRAIGSQLMRSGTSVGANYRAACRGKIEKQNSSRRSALLKRKQTKAHFGWN